MYTITLTMDEGCGLDMPRTRLARSREDAASALKTWVEKHMDLDAPSRCKGDKDKVLSLIDDWNGNSELSFMNGYGESIVVQYHIV